MATTKKSVVDAPRGGVVKTRARRCGKALRAGKEEAQNSKWRFFLFILFNGERKVKKWIF